MLGAAQITRDRNIRTLLSSMSRTRPGITGS